jgi:hypothetical protein
VPGKLPQIVMTGLRVVRPEHLDDQAVIALQHAEAMMDDVIDRVLTTYSLIRPLRSSEIDASREKIGGYLEKLAKAGQTDVHELTVYGLAYLKELHEGPNPRFTGC